MNSHNKITIGLIHALEESEEPIKQSFQKIWSNVILNEYSALVDYESIDPLAQTQIV